jgi:hypothetical protein
MARYPSLPVYHNRNYQTNGEFSIEDLRKMYEQVQEWSSVLIDELGSKDIEVDARPSTNIYTVVTITDIGRPSKGDIAYSINTGKFKGYVSLGAETSWQDLN